MKLLTIVGARPQFIKAAMVSRAIVAHNSDGADPLITEEILHTGQHYDRNMSDVFFEQMGIPPPAVNLNVGSGTHGRTTGEMLAGIEAEILARRPDWVLVYGDTNSTLAGALAAVKLHVPVAHVEAGLRSFNRAMPEEINRVLTDHVSALLLCPTGTAIQNLRNEGITGGVHHVGDVMYDAALVFAQIAEQRSTVLDDLGLASGAYALATVHRAENTDNPDRLRGAFEGLAAVNRGGLPVVLPLHPRTRARLADTSVQDLANQLQLIEPVSFLDMVMLEKHARVILTDSGGVQKEAYFHHVPCVTLRDETEWVETVEAGWNTVVGADPEAITAAVTAEHTRHDIPDYGSGNASKAVIDALLAHMT